MISPDILNLKKEKRKWMSKGPSFSVEDKKVVVFVCIIMQT